jgi:predicted flap endonuclease-1-like 5' DNA nuclease
MTEGTEAITTVHLVLMVMLAALAVLVIVVGMRKKHRRVQAEREVEAHAAEAGVPIVPPPASDPLPRVPDESAPPSIADRPTSHALPPVDVPPEQGVLADEPIAAAAVPEGTAATIALDADAAGGQPSPADGPLTQLKGLGPKVATRLGELGIDRVGQLAALDDAQAVSLDSEMGPFAGRMARDRWIEQARLLAAGDTEGFERVFGKL